MHFFKCPQNKRFKSWKLKEFSSDSIHLCAEKKQVQPSFELGTMQACMSNAYITELSRTRLQKDKYYI